MKRIVTSFAVACLLLFAANSASAIPGFSLGVDVGVNMPTGDWADSAGTGFAGLIYASFDALPMIKITGRAGYIHHLEENSINQGLIPVLVGVKWYPLAIGLYAAAEMGMTGIRTDTPQDDDTEWKLGGTLGAGFSFRSLDARVALYVPEFEEVDHAVGLLITAGYRF